MFSYFDLIWPIRNTNTFIYIPLLNLNHYVLVANLADTNDEKKLKMAETLAYGYSSESTQRKLFNEYQHVRI